MITVAQAEKIHQALVKNFGGAQGIRDLPALESALARPFQTFAGNDLYPSILEKAGALIESILVNHPFVDGNKRTGYVLMRSLLKQHSLDIAATEDEKYSFVINIASGHSNIEIIVSWLKQHLV